MIEEPQDDLFEFLHRLAKAMLIVILIACGIIIFGSCSTYRYCAGNFPIKDSLVKETTHTIVFKEIEQLGKLKDSTASAIVSVTEISHLETDAATSDAWIDSSGNLNHTLENKTDGLTPILVNIPNEITTEKIYLTKSIVQYKERELSRWEEFFLSLGKISLFVMVLTILYLGFKLWKKVRSFGLF